jgi:hypothetical protein
MLWSRVTRAGSASPFPRKAVLPIAACAALLGGIAALELGCSSSGSSPASASEPDGADTAPSARDDGGVPGTGVADASVAPARSDAPGSAGSGGLPCSRQESLGGGRTSCVTTVRGVELKLVLPASGAGAMRLGLYLHGDGAEAHESGSVATAMVPWADATHGIGVSALAPNRCSWWQSLRHDCASLQTERDLEGENVALLAGAIDAIASAYDVRTDGLRYYGSSGGSIFLTEAWIPLQAGNYPGVFALMCGGEPTSRAYAWDLTNASWRARNPLWFTYGDQDVLAPEIARVAEDFRSVKFTVTEKVFPGAGHCQFNGTAEAMAIWTANP